MAFLYRLVSHFFAAKILLLLERYRVLGSCSVLCQVLAILSRLPEINPNHADKRGLPFEVLNSTPQRKIGEHRKEQIPEAKSAF